ncbi:MAG: M14 family metallopeptidase [Gammaproteobacteria bacterium]|nr:MAG: M14 family metallopeptidase [Gammaproteobacteria bacterium]
MPIAPTDTEQRLLEYFPADYFSARERFNRLAAARGAQSASYRIAARGPGDQALSIDTAYFGAESPRRLLILSSGVHGAEGFTGSALQQHIANDLIDMPGGGSHGGILLVHALNPYGFAHRRRANESNVDINRNALTHFPGPANPAYAAFDAVLNPPAPAARDARLTARLLWRALRIGPRAARQAIAGGQYEFPKGLFYGGAKTEESLGIFKRILRTLARKTVTKVLHIDLHTGLGKYRDYKLFAHLPTAAPTLAPLRAWCGDRVLATADPGGYAASGLIGSLTRAVYGEAHSITVTLELGTYPLLRVLSTLRNENQLYHYGASAPGLAKKIQNDCLQTFCPRDPRWRLAALGHGARVFRRVCDGFFA